MNRKHSLQSLKHRHPGRHFILMGSALAALSLLVADYPLAFAQSPANISEPTLYLAGTQMSTVQGQNWTLVSWQEDSKAIALVSRSITAQFADGGISGMGGCNRYRATYRADAEKIQVNAILSTRMACLEPQLSTQENRYFSALQTARILKLNAQNQLVIEYQTPTGKTGLLTFTAMNAAQPPQSLDGSAWTLVGWQQGTSARTLVDKTEITADFSGDRISGSGGCNRFSGTYRQQAETVSVSNLSMTEMACESAAIMAQEAELLKAIAGIQTVQPTVPGQMQLAYRSEQGETGLLTFTQSPRISLAAPQAGTGDDTVIQGNADGSVVEQTLQPPTPGVSEAQPPKDCP